MDWKKFCFFTNISPAREYVTKNNVKYPSTNANFVTEKRNESKQLTKKFLLEYLLLSVHITLFCTVFSGINMPKIWKIYFGYRQNMYSIHEWTAVTTHSAVVPLFN
jgi:hypothetical protein